MPEQQRNWDLSHKGTPQAQRECTMRNGKCRRLQYLHSECICVFGRQPPDSLLSRAKLVDPSGLGQSDSTLSL